MKYNYYLYIKMNYKSYMKPIILFEFFLEMAFLYFLFSPGMIPRNIALFIESSLGMIILLSIAILLFVYTHLIVSITFIFVAYELIRRSTKSNQFLHDIRYSPSQSTKDRQLQAMNPPREMTLEEETIMKMTPYNTTEYIESSYRPVYYDDHNAFKL